MSNYFSLLKTDFLNTYTFINKKQSIGKVILGIFSSVLVVVIMAIIAINIGAVSVILSGVDMLGELFILLALTSTFLVLLTGIRIMSTGLFDSNDHELLSSLPIKPRTILMAKLTRTYIDSNYLSFILIFPSIIGIGIFNKFPITYYILTFLTFMLVPSISIVISAVVAIFMMKLFNRFSFMKKIFSFLYLLIYAAIFVPYFISSMSVQQNNQNIDMEDIANVITSTRDSLASTLKFYPFSGLIKNITINRDIVSFIIFAIINIILLVLFAVIFEKSYKNISLSLKENRSMTTSKLQKDKYQKVKQSSVVFSLIKKDIIQFSEYNIVIMQVFMGGLLGAIMTYAFGRSDLTNLPIDAQYTPFIGLALLAILAYMSCISPYTAFSTSIEGKNFWVIKSLPIKESDYFKSKIYISLAVSIPLSIISLVILYFQIDVNLLTMFFYSLILILIIIASTIISLYFNLLLPNLKWDNINKAVKNAGSVIATIGYSFLHLFVSAGIGVAVMIFSDFNFILVCLSLCAFEVILLILGLVLLNTHGKKLYRKIQS